MTAVPVRARDPRVGLTSGDDQRPQSHSGKLRVVIRGGGVAALETMLALRDLGARTHDVLVIAPANRVRLPADGRPRAVAYGPAQHYALAPIIDTPGATLLADRLAWVDREAPTTRAHRRPVSGSAYGALRVALGAILGPH